MFVPPQRTPRSALSGQMRKTRAVWQVSSAWCWLLLCLSVRQLWPLTLSSFQLAAWIVGDLWMWSSGMTNDGEKNKVRVSLCCSCHVCQFPRKLKYSHSDVSWCCFHFVLLDSCFTQRRLTQTFSVCRCFECWTCRRVKRDIVVLAAVICCWAQRHLKVHMAVFVGSDLRVAGLEACHYSRTVTHSSDPTADFHFPSTALFSKINHISIKKVFYWSALHEIILCVAPKWTKTVNSHSF